MSSVVRECRSTKSFSENFAKALLFTVYLPQIYNIAHYFTYFEYDLLLAALTTLANFLLSWHTKFVEKNCGLASDLH